MKDEEMVYEGGVDAPPADEKPKSNRQARKEHYKARIDEFKVTDCGLNQQTGMNYGRGCTDFLCAVLFLAFLSVMFASAIYGLIKGEPRTMVAPYDHSEMTCGVDEDVKDYGKLYLAKLGPQPEDEENIHHPTRIMRRIFFEDAVCVKKCPVSEDDTLEGNMNDQKSADLIMEANDNIIATHSVMDICWPDFDKMSEDDKDNWMLVINGLERNVVFMQLMSMYSAWKAIVFSMFMALILSIAYIYFLSIFAEYVAWGIIFATQIGLIALSLFSFYFYTKTDENGKSGVALAVGIISGLFAIIFCLLVYFAWNQLKLSIEIVNCSADFLAATKRLLGVPVAYYAVLFFFFLFWIACMISVESMGKITPDPTNKITSPYFPMKKDISWTDRREQGKLVNLILGILIFGLCWFSFFLKHSSNYVVMVTAASFYFSSNKDHYGNGSLALGFRWAWIHNFGSLAFGSLIITIIFVIRVVTYYFCKKAEKLSGDNPVVKALVCLVTCFLKCLEEIMEYINKAAYAYMAISGQNFCKSALDGLLLQFKHGLKFGFANLLASGFIMLGKLGLTVLNVFLTYFYMQQTHALEEGSNPYAPLSLVALMTFMLVSIFLGMFDEAVLALMTSFCADMDINGQPKWGPESLHKAIEKINDTIDDDDMANVSKAVAKK